MSDDIDRISKDIEDYNRKVGYGVTSQLERLLEQTRVLKEAQPKSAETRHWAVVFTQLENTIAYVKTYLGGS